MKGFLEWFKRGTKIKRWMLLIFVGMMLICYAIAQVLVYDELDASIFVLGRIVVSFVLGFLCIIMGFVFFNKRVLEVYIEATDDRMENRDSVNVKSLIFNKTVYDQGPNIVAIGGGSGLNTILSGMKKYTSNITAIVAVTDYGDQANSSKIELGLLPIKDIKDSMIALSNKDGEMGELFNHQFRHGRLEGLTFADVYFAGMKEINSNFSDSILKSNEILNIVGKVLPVTHEEIHISAELNNGYIVNEKAKIPEVTAEKVSKINRVFITPSNCRPAPGVIEAIQNADSIIIGPGSLYTNVIPNLLVPGVARAIKESKAIKIYISNIMTDQGQTDDYSVADHINAITEHCGEGLIDYCIYDTGEIVPEYIKMYNKEGADLVEQDIESVQTKHIKYIHKNISMIQDGRIRHDANLVASSVIELICNDLEYKDKQFDPQFMLLNSKLQSDKRLQKIKLKQEKEKRRKERNPRRAEREAARARKSKFSSKYEERIKSIKDSSEKEKRIKAKQKKQREDKMNEVNKRMREFRKTGYKKNG